MTPGRGRRQVWQPAIIAFPSNLRIVSLKSGAAWLAVNRRNDKILYVYIKSYSNEPLIVKQILVLLSGRGSNLQALLDGQGIGHYRIAGVVSNVATAGGLDKARCAGVPAVVVEHRRFPGRPQFEAALTEAIDSFSADLIVLAGFMRVLSAVFVQRYSGRLLNIHPSLLPAFTGLNTHRQALLAGVKLHGATVHVVTAELDAGPIVAQAVVPVWNNDDETTLATRVLEVEHALLFGAVRDFCAGRWSVVDGQVIWLDTMPPFLLLHPALQGKNCDSRNTQCQITST
ncbi:MAG: phosphoribosylglycinamide formyltransferase [Burkholderiaceae bacterium]|jgi:phosphoribosylglycinamide formyltransferase-1